MAQIVEPHRRQFRLLKQGAKCLTDDGVVERTAVGLSEDESRLLPIISFLTFFRRLEIPMRSFEMSEGKPDSKSDHSQFALWHIHELRKEARLSVKELCRWIDKASDSSMAFRTAKHNRPSATSLTSFGL